MIWNPRFWLWNTLHDLWWTCWWITESTLPIPSHWTRWWDLGYKLHLKKMKARREQIQPPATTQEPSSNREPTQPEGSGCPS